MFFDNLKFACKEKKTSPSAVALLLGMSKSNVTNWKNGGIPSPDVLLKIANTLDVSVDYLLGNKKEPTTVNDDELSADELKFITLVRQLPPDRRKVIEALALTLRNEQ